ncbi:MAG: outer membrane beta-barrel protein [Bacteroidales bacterium]|nr:outer membrane beta-barrel protein [Bacteroidales bacterium]MBR5532199.1 outer membrane beta-barrel protein [Bacteroidales bacterium]
MKTINKSIISVILFISLIVVPHTAKSQITENGYIDVDWQFNIPINTSFADKAAGWGMSFDGGYYITDNFGIGAFMTYSTNNEYIERQTLKLTETSSLTTDQQHSIFQLPFGVSVRYRFIPDAIVKPYMALKLGPEYSKVSSYYNSFTSSDDGWGFYVSPEIGTTIYFTSSQTVGIHLALYYAYATNKSKVLIYDVKGLNNAGFKLGMSF